MVLARTCLVLLCAAGALPGQTEVIERHENGSVHRRYTVDAEGRRLGAFLEFDAEGTLLARAVYKEDQLEGRYQAYHPNGKRKLWANYRGGKLNGRFTTFREDGKKHVVAHYHDNLLHGKYEAVYENGQVKERTRYRHARLHGDYESFFPNGNPRIKAVFDSGKRHGRYEESNEDQSHNLTEHFHHGVRHGVYQVVDKGNLVIDQVWEMGRVHKIKGVVAYPVPEDTIRKELRRILQLPAAVAVAAKLTAAPKDAATAKEAGAKVEIDTPEAALRRLKAYRFLCRVPYLDLRLDPRLNEHCVNGARLCERIGRLAHEPECPEGMDKADYRRGLIGTTHSNLHQGSGLVGSVDAYMEDAGENNLAHVGHRRWCLNPRMRKTGFGNSGEYCAMWAHDEGGPKVKRGEICYPPRGYVPVGFFGSDHLWSVMLMSGRKLTRSRIRIRIYPLNDEFLRAGDDLPIKDLRVNCEGMPGSCIIFRPLLLKASPGCRYWVEIRLGSGRSKAIQYLVEFVGDLR